MKKNGCNGPKTLAHLPGYRVDYCGGLFHICIGPITVHLEPAAFLTFSDVITHAAAQTGESSTPSEPVLSLVHRLGGDVAES